MKQPWGDPAGSGLLRGSVLEAVCRARGAGVVGRLVFPAGESPAQP